MKQKTFYQKSNYYDGVKVVIKLALNSFDGETKSLTLEYSIALAFENSNLAKLGLKKC